MTAKYYRGVLARVEKEEPPGGARPRTTVIALTDPGRGALGIKSR